MYRDKYVCVVFRCVSEVTGGPIPPFPIFPHPHSRTTTFKFLTPKKPCPWAAAIAYHQDSPHDEESFCDSKPVELFFRTEAAVEHNIPFQPRIDLFVKWVEL
uniref:SFRICE_035669 n=1 Tax=Spodoptera frugiperda TaxID=7108 RepID=A0A2H1VQF7_SPOFR